MDYEEMLLQICEVLRKHNRPCPDISSQKTIEEIRNIVNVKIVKECTNCKYFEYSPDSIACQSCEGIDDPNNWEPLKN